MCGGELGVLKQDPTRLSFRPAELEGLLLLYSDTRKISASILQRSHASLQVCTQIWKCCLHSSGFRVMKDIQVRGLWNLSLWLQSTTVDRCVAEETLLEGLEQPFYKVVKVKPRLH